MRPELIYLDTCALQRPLDARHSTVGVAEAASICAIVEAIARGRIWLVRSDVLDAECRHPRAPAAKRLWAARVLALARVVVAGAEARERAAELAQLLRLAPVDALHLACAEYASATFVTVDRRLLDRVSRRSELVRTTAADPLAVAARLQRRRR